MLKLKIGTNYLVTVDEYNDRDDTLLSCIYFMMGNFNGVNLLATPIFTPPGEVIKGMTEHRTNTIYVLTRLDVLQLKKTKGKERYKSYMRDYKYELAAYTYRLKELKPDIDIKYININHYFKTREYIFAIRLFNQLCNDNTSIASVLNKLGTYKNISKRYANIPKELQVIENDIKRLAKTTQTCERKATVEGLKYLKLIKEARLSGHSLDLILEKLPIYPSEELGVVFAQENFRDNPYLYNAAKYIYLGGHFQMPETHIQIDNGFRPTFIETLDHRWDRMFRYHNWSTVGYPHFGQNHLCPGEFNDTMAHGREYGLEYYFIALKQYLTTANMRDTAGARVWWYPIYNDEGEMVYCAGMDILLEEWIKPNRPEVYRQIKDLTWEEKSRVIAEYDFDGRNISRYTHNNCSYYGSNRDKDYFLQLVKEREPEVYDKIMKGRAYNG